MLNISKRISIQDLSKELGHKDYRKTIKWLKNRGIPFKKEGRGYYVLKWHIEFATYLEIAQDLKARFPNSWSAIFQESFEDSRMINAVFEVCPPIYVQKIKGSDKRRTFFK